MQSNARIEGAAVAARADLIKHFRRSPFEFFTESDLAAFFIHRFHIRYPEDGAVLIHAEYPTPFRCQMVDGTFVPKGEKDRTPGGKLFKRGHFDVVVLNPAFIAECRNLSDDAQSYSLRKGQAWNVFRPFLEARLNSSEPVALRVFELMFLRDPFSWRSRVNRGEGTMARVARDVVQDYQKLQYAVSPNASGYRFAASGEMILFDNQLDAVTLRELRTRVPGASVISALHGCE